MKYKIVRTLAEVNDDADGWRLHSVIQGNDRAPPGYLLERIEKSSEPEFLVETDQQTL